MPHLTLDGRPEIVAYNHIREDADHEALVRKAGGEILGTREIAVGTTMGGYSTELHYRLPDGRERWAYICPHRADIDAFAEESLICTAALPDDIEVIGDAFIAARVEVWKLKHPPRTG